MRLKEYINEAYNFKKGDVITWKAPDGTGMEGTVITGDIRGKLEVMPNIGLSAKTLKAGKDSVLVPVKGATNVTKLKKRMKSGSAAMYHHDTA